MSLEVLHPRQQTRYQRPVLWQLPEHLGESHAYVMYESDIYHTYAYWQLHDTVTSGSPWLLGSDAWAQHQKRIQRSYSINNRNWNMN